MTGHYHNIERKQSNEERWFRTGMFQKKRGTCLSEFAHVTDEDNHIFRCYRANLSPTNPAHQNIFDLLKNPKNNAFCKESTNYDDKIKLTCEMLSTITSTINVSSTVNNTVTNQRSVLGCALIHN